MQHGPTSIIIPLLQAAAACTGDPPTQEPEDYDGDGHSTAEGDCNDRDPDIYPSATEQCNVLDDDCDGQVDEPEEASSVTWYPDADGDGFGASDAPCLASTAGDGYATRPGDCDDADPAINPIAPELCDDGFDNDCDRVQPDCGIAGNLTTAEASRWAT